MKINETLDRYGNAIVIKLRNLIAPKSATGKTVQSVTYTVTKDEGSVSLRIFAREFLSTLETGRGPRKSSIQGDFQRNMLEWMAARGIDKGSEKKNINFARYLTLKINREGDATYRKGGVDLFSKEINEMTTALENEITDNFAEEALLTVTNMFK